MRSAIEAMNADRSRSGTPLVGTAGGHVAPPGPSTVEIGTLFRDLRRALKVSLPELASRLGTRIDVINALEKGDVRRLPPWPETVRIVTAFTAMARIDARPVLNIMRERHYAPSPARSASPRLEKLKSFASQAAVAARAAVPSWRRQRTGHDDEVSLAAAWRIHGATLVRIGLLTLVILVLSGTAYYVRAGGLQASIASLPPPLAHLARSAQDYVLWYAAPTRDGLKWIEVEDPRARRGDRLDTSRR